jgi:hypothetical protein
LPWVGGWVALLATTARDDRHYDADLLGSKRGFILTGFDFARLSSPE